MYVAGLGVFGLSDELLQNSRRRLLLVPNLFRRFVSLLSHLVDEATMPCSQVETKKKANP
jgi:hypothetical protein